MNKTTVHVYFENDLLWWLDPRNPSSNLKYPATGEIFAGVAESFRREGLGVIMHAGELESQLSPTIYSELQESIDGRSTPQH